MDWTELHYTVLARAFEKVLGKPDQGAMAFTRCLLPDAVKRLAGSDAFSPDGWKVLRIADVDDKNLRTITADTAVERREGKGDPALLLVDTQLAGAGMDGIYSAAREIDEDALFNVALRLAGAEVTKHLSKNDRQYAERAVRKARSGGRSVPPRVAFDYLCRIAASRQSPGAWLPLLGLWPVADDEYEDRDGSSRLDDSRRFVDQLLGVAAAGLTIPARIEALRLARPESDQKRDLQRFLYKAHTKSLASALESLANHKPLWIGHLKIEQSQEIQGIELLSWRNRNGKVAKWSGLEDQGDAPPVLMFKPGAEHSSDYSHLEIKWKAQPGNLDKNAVDYRIAVLTGMGEELASRETPHAARNEEKCRFNNDDFIEHLHEDSLISAKVQVSVIGNDAIKPQESEEFSIRFGEPPEKTAGGAGQKIRAFSEGLIELEDRDAVSTIADDRSGISVDEKKNLLLLRTSSGTSRKSFSVFRPPLIGEIESQTPMHEGIPGRWKVKVRASGERVGKPDFIKLRLEDRRGKRVKNAGKKFARPLRIDALSSVGQIYDEKSRAFDTVKEYLLAWVDLMKRGDSESALCHTVEVQSLSGWTIGLIVLPTHPLRVAWHAAYDNLVLHAAYEEGQKPKDIRAELKGLDGALFPAFLPNPEGGAFVFADMLGFHAVGMVPDADKEPKAAVALLARALGLDESAGTAPTVDSQSAMVLAGEVKKYLDCHNTSRLLHVHALRPGDGQTVVRALGHVHHQRNANTVASEDADEDEASYLKAQAFSLELYPSNKQRGVSGRFIADAREKRHSGAGVLPEEDRWMLESLSLPGGVNLPRLRWARREIEDPQMPAHLAVAFDTFTSQVKAGDAKEAPDTRPYHAFGLLSFYQRQYVGDPMPRWSSTVPARKDGEKHPSERGHSERLERLQQAMRNAVCRHLSADNSEPVLRTKISSERSDSLKQLHQLCDWVITLDRNAGIEYFDSPRDNPEIYDAYVIDCVPEREDLGCLQLITSTSNLDEVCGLLDATMEQMGLGRSRRNAEFLLGRLKALSGRLAIRLTGNRPPAAELVALAVAHAHCRRPNNDERSCWMSLDQGFIVPADDVREFLPPPLQENKFQSRLSLIYVSTVSRKLSFQFIDVKYHRHLQTARAPEVLEQIRKQTGDIHEHWYDWYSNHTPASFRAVRRARLARVLHFYADRAHRHGLSDERYKVLGAEIGRMVEKGGDYVLGGIPLGDRGWVFCPEYTGSRPLEISPDDWEARIFLFGPALLPDPGLHGEAPSSTADTPPSAPPIEAYNRDDVGVNLRASSEVREGDAATSSSPVADEDGASADSAIERHEEGEKEATRQR